ncbi:hypothetical protein BGZ97_002650, partial [Linnemannia gamsii]
MSTLLTSNPATRSTIPPPVVKDQTATTKTTTTTTLTSKTILTSAKMASAKPTPPAKKPCADAQRREITAKDMKETEKLVHQYRAFEKHSLDPERRAFSSYWDLTCRKCLRVPVRQVCMEYDGCYPGCC